MKNRILALLITVISLTGLLLSCSNDPADTEYTVTFDKNGGDTDASPKTKKVTLPATAIDALPTEPARADYLFISWNTKADGSGSAFTAATPVTASITVYAQWEAVPEGSFIVTFDKNGGDTDASPTTKLVIPPETTIDALPEEPTRTDYTFNGWNTEADGSGSAFTHETTVSARITVYAQWKVVVAGSHTVTFDKNNDDLLGSTEANPKTITVTASETNVGELPVEPKRTDYTFKSWNTKADGSGLPFTASTPVTASIPVYAQWTANTYTVTFDKNNDDLSGNTDANPKTISVTVPETIIDTLPLVPTRLNYTFKSWNTKADGSGSPFTEEIPVTASITVYAQWTAAKILKYTFETNAANSLVEFNTGKNPSTTASVANNRLEINIGSNYGNDVVILPFNLGSDSLADYTSIVIRLAAGNSNGANKDFNVVVSPTNVFSNSSVSPNQLLCTQGSNCIAGYTATPTWNTRTIPMTLASGRENYTGLVKIGFWINCETNSMYYIESVELVK